MLKTVQPNCLFVLSVFESVSTIQLIYHDIHVSHGLFGVLETFPPSLFVGISFFFFVGTVACVVLTDASNV